MLVLQSSTLLLYFLLLLSIKSDKITTVLGCSILLIFHWYYKAHLSCSKKKMTSSQIFCTQHSAFGLCLIGLFMLSNSLQIIKLIAKPSLDTPCKNLKSFTEVISFPWGPVNTT